MKYKVPGSVLWRTRNDFIEVKTWKGYRRSPSTVGGDSKANM